MHPMSVMSITHGELSQSINMLKCALKKHFALNENLTKGSGGGIKKVTIVVGKDLVANSGPFY